jgi:hypothetical protein
MSTEAKVPDTEHLLREVLDEWKAGVDDHDPGRTTLGSRSTSVSWSPKARTAGGSPTYQVAAVPSSARG